VLLIHSCVRSKNVKCRFNLGHSVLLYIVMMSVWIRFSATKETYDQNVYEFRVLEFGMKSSKRIKSTILMKVHITSDIIRDRQGSSGAEGHAQ